MIAALVLLLLIPISMIRSLVRDREQTAKDAEAGIMEAWGSELIAAGPVLVFDGEAREETRTKTEKDGEKISVQFTRVKGFLTPKTLNITSSLKTEVRRRGIFSVPLFYGEMTLSGTFDRAMFHSSSYNETYNFNAAAMVISLGSQKGIKKITKAEWNGGDLFFEPGNEGYALFTSRNVRDALRGYEADLPHYESDSEVPFTQGVHARLLGGGADGGELPQEITFTITMEIQGGRLARFMPIAQDTHVKIDADWASPSFQGAFLPADSSISGSGFSAEWDISYLSRDIPLYWTQTNSGSLETIANGSLFGVDFFRAIDTYSLNTRAVKYAILFLIVPFLTLFLLEMFAKARIHPVPYLLSGIGNAVFYLLLLSLSEQMAFYTAYIISGYAVTALLTLYSRALLQSWRSCRYMGFVCALSYILLYAVLNAQSYALLIGSVGTFVVIALVMFLTRKLDWYGET